MRWINAFDVDVPCKLQTISQQFFFANFIRLSASNRYKFKSCSIESTTGMCRKCKKIEATISNTTDRALALQCQNIEMVHDKNRVDGTQISNHLINPMFDIFTIRFTEAFTEKTLYLLKIRNEKLLFSNTTMNMTLNSRPYEIQFDSIPQL